MSRWTPSIAPSPPAPLRLRAVDALLVTIAAFALFAYCGISGRPLTMHEARLPQTSREMLVNHDWLLPHSGIRPWLERPPLPHWVVVASIKAFAAHAAFIPVWVVRLPSALMGAVTVLLTTLIAGKWFGRGIGVTSGLLLATSFEFYRYAGSAEDDIYLGAVVALAMGALALAEFHPRYAADSRMRPVASRPWPILAFFFFAGLSNWTKGPLLGMAVAGSALGCYLLWNALIDGDWRQIARYLWFWGWLLMLALTVAWPAYAYRHYPDVLKNWRYDYLGRVNGTYSDINEPWYYYAPTLAGAMLPWTPAVLVGLAATIKTAFAKSAVAPSHPTASLIPAAASSARPRIQRFIWSWAIAPLILFSIPKGKHHHYLIPFLAPWAILGAIGIVEMARPLLVRRSETKTDWTGIGIGIFGVPAAVAIAWFRQMIPGDVAVKLAAIIGWPVAVGLILIGLRRQLGALVLGVILAVVAAGYCWGETYLAARTDQTVDDTAFLLRARGEVPASAPLFINANLGPIGNLDFFRIQFYSRPDAVLLHNLTYLRDENIHANVVYVITRSGDAAKLSELGEPTVIDRSAQSHEQKAGGGPFTLFRLTFNSNLKRYPAPRAITNKQAMDREHGPWCGPPL